MDHSSSGLRPCAMHGSAEPIWDALVARVYSRRRPKPQAPSPKPQASSRAPSPFFGDGARPSLEHLAANAPGAGLHVVVVEQGHTACRLCQVGEALSRGGQIAAPPFG